MSDGIHGDEMKAAGGQSSSNGGLGSLYAPGSQDAVAHGCTCPVMDNGNGKGCGYTSALAPGVPLYWFDFSCPLHGHNESIPGETICYEMPNAELRDHPQADGPA